MNLVTKIIFTIIKNILFFIDFFFVIFQSLFLRFKFIKNFQSFILPIGGWGVAIHSVCFLNRINNESKKKKILYVFNFQKYNFFLKDFLKKIFIIKIILLNNILKKKNYNHWHLNILATVFIFFYSKSNIFDLRKHLHKDNFAFSDSVFPAQIKNLLNFKIFRFVYTHYNYFYYAKFKNIYPNFKIFNFFKRNFKVTNIFINKSINFYVRKKNDNDPTSKIRDFEIKKVDKSINFFLKKGYNVFLTGDLRGYKRFEYHKNFYSYQKFQSVSFELYNIFFQSVIKYHVSNAGGGNEIFKYNKCKILFIDYWPYWKHYPRSLMLYKKILDKKNRTVKLSKLLYSFYSEIFLLFNKKLSYKLISHLSIKKMILKDFNIISRDSSEILTACKEYYNFINNKNINEIKIKKNSQLDNLFPFSMFIKKFDCHILKINKF